jgi:hypothetical protein
MRQMWLAFTVLASAFVGVGGGVLSSLGGEHPARAVLAGGGTFAATLTIGILVLTFLDGAGPGRPRR